MLRAPESSHSPVLDGGLGEVRRVASERVDAAALAAQDSETLVGARKSAPGQADSEGPRTARIWVVEVVAGIRFRRGEFREHF